jgi:hypothetical protein
MPLASFPLAAAFPRAESCDASDAPAPRWWTVHLPAWASQAHSAGLREDVEVGTAPSPTPRAAESPPALGDIGRLCHPC